MWHRRRLLKKEKRTLGKKRLLFISLVMGVLGIACLGLGIVLMMREPLYVSPLPLFKPLFALDDERVVKASIEAELKKRQITFSAVTQLEQNTYKIEIKNNGEALVTSKKDIQAQLSSLQVITSRLTMEGKKFTRLDLRFDRPVISLQ